MYIYAIGLWSMYIGFDEIKDGQIINSEDENKESEIITYT